MIIRLKNEGPLTPQDLWEMAIRVQEDCLISFTVFKDDDDGISIKQVIKTDHGLTDDEMRKAFDEIADESS